MLKYRLIFGPIMIAALVGLLFLDNHLDRVRLTGTVWQTLFFGRGTLPAGLVLLLLMLVLIGLGTRELVRIFHAKGIDANPLMIALAGLSGCVLMYIIPFRLDSQTTVAIYASALTALFVFTLIRYSFTARRTQGVIAVAAVSMFSMVYIGILPGFYLAIRRWHSAWVIGAILLVTKACDIGAYFAGRALGRHKLIPWLSPGKTWEGLVGGVLLSMLLAAVLVALGNHYQVIGVFEVEAETSRYIPFVVPLWYAALCGGLIGIVGQIGDLTASLFKRDAGIKDSGSSIPGFGGMLDVVDSPILVAPLAYWLLRLAAAVFGP